jgi:hypothetical protein
MAEVTPDSATPTTAAPEVAKQICEKCRNSYPLEAFDHKVEGQGCVCRRCLTVMGYRV